MSALTIAGFFTILVYSLLITWSAWAFSTTRSGYRYIHIGLIIFNAFTCAFMLMRYTVEHYT